MIGYFALTASNFDSLQFATLLGLNQLVKFLLAMVVLALMPMFLGAGGDWREYFLAMGIVFLPFVPLILWAGRTLPAPRRANGKGLLHSVWQDLGLVCGEPQIRRALLIGFLGSGSIMAFNGLWYLPFARAAGYSLQQADNLGSLSMLAMGLGMTFAGWISDRLRRRKPILVIGQGITFVAMLVLIAWVEPPLVAEAVLVLVMSLFSAAFLALLYVLVKESVPSQLSSTAIGVVNTAIFGGLAFMQWLPGALLKLSSDASSGLAHSSIIDYQLALLIYPPAVLISLLITLACGETARPTEPDQTGEPNE